MSVVGTDADRRHRRKLMDWKDLMGARGKGWGFVEGRDVQVQEMDEYRLYVQKV